ncbi:MAG: DUF5343 domain-containing protein [Cellvibrionaceae bacterium]|nr:DUF5343 domain-containing protein [Cellvibrionaceae bacterium]
MLTKRYLASVKNLGDILQKIQEGTAPPTFSVEHLKGIGFASSNDRAIIPLLKDLGFLSANGVPTQRYHNYRNPSLSKKIMGEALHEAYEELFHINAKPSKSDRDAIVGKFKTAHNVKDRVAESQAMTFFGLLDHADLSSQPSQPASSEATTEEKPEPEGYSNGGPIQSQPATMTGIPNLRYNIEIHLPATKDIEVYNAIFKSLKEHLVE